MRTWKIITISVLALVAIALTTASAFALMGRQGYYTPYNTPAGTYGNTESYVPSPSGTVPYGGYYGSYGAMGGGWGCGGMRARGFGYGAPAYP